VRFLIRLVSSAVVVALLALATGPTVGAQEDLQGKLLTIEKSLWEGWKNKDGKPFEKHLAEDVVNITVQGISSGKAQIVKDITTSDCDVKGFTLAEPKLHHLGKEAAMITYKASQDAVCGGQKIPAEVYVSAVYVNQGGEWKSRSYQETAAPAAK
jgi:hypothetical protein